MPLRNRLFRPLSTAVLIIVTAALATAAATLLYLDRGPDAPDAGVGREIFREQAAVLADPHELAINDGDQPTTLRRDGELWRVIEKDGYPARQDLVSKLLERLRDPRALRRVAVAEGDFADLGVGTDEGAWQRRISVEDQTGARLEIVVGKDRSAPGSSDMTAVHVRRAGSDTVWLVDADLRAAAGPMDWLDTQALTLPRGEIDELRTAPPSGEPLVLRRPSPDAAGLEPVDRPDEDAQLEPGAVTEPVSAFTAVVFEDVRRADDTAPPETGTGMVRTVPGSTVTYWFQEIDGETWARFAVERPQRVGNDIEKADETGTESPEPGLRTPDNVRLEDWAFRLPPYTLERMRRALSDIPTSQPETDAAADAR